LIVGAGFLRDSEYVVSIGYAVGAFPVFGPEACFGRESTTGDFDLNR
jgi:hypothetical protein